MKVWIVVATSYEYTHVESVHSDEREASLALARLAAGPDRDHQFDYHVEEHKVVA